MDPSRIESYLRATCSVLDFDIGELWCARKPPGQKPILKFIQLYTSPTYEDFHSLLIQPDISTDLNSTSDEETHRFSPVICRGVLDGGQIVWANTRIQEGLTGRIDLPLNTAVGVPICSIGLDLYILVLFAVGLIPMTSQAVEYLTTVSRAVTEGPTGFLSASFSSAVAVTPAKTEDFVGLWDISDLMNKYSQDIEFHLLPLQKLQKFFDCHEILLFCDLFTDFKLARDGRFTVKQIETLRETYRRERSDSVASDDSKRWEIHLTDKSPHDDHQEEENAQQALSTTSAAALEVTEDAFSDMITQQPLALLPDTTDTVISSTTTSSKHGVYCIDLNSVDLDISTHGGNTSSNNKHPKSPVAETQPTSPAAPPAATAPSAPAVAAALPPLPSQSQPPRAKQLVCSSSADDLNKSVLHIYAHMTYKLSQCRFHEFMIAVLGMTVFEGAELWLVSERKSELFLVAGVYRSTATHKLINISETMRLRIGSDGPGKIVELGRSYWDEHFSEVTFETIDPRKIAANEIGIHTEFGVPLPGLRGICGAVMFYSTKSTFSPEPLLILLIERAIQLMTTGALEANSIPRIESGIWKSHRSSSFGSSDALNVLGATPTQISSGMSGIGGYPIQQPSKKFTTSSSLSPTDPMNRWLSDSHSSTTTTTSSSSTTATATTRPIYHPNPSHTSYPTVSSTIHTLAIPTTTTTTIPTATGSEGMITQGQGGQGQGFIMQSLHQRVQQQQQQQLQQQHDLKATTNFDEKLQICRSIVHNKQSSTSGTSAGSIANTTTTTTIRTNASTPTTILSASSSIQPFLGMLHGAGQPMDEEEAVEGEGGGGVEGAIPTTSTGGIGYQQEMHEDTEMVGMVYDEEEDDMMPPPATTSSTTSAADAAAVAAGNVLLRSFQLPTLRAWNTPSPHTTNTMNSLNTNHMYHPKGAMSELDRSQHSVSSETSDPEVTAAYTLANFGRNMNSMNMKTAYPSSSNTATANNTGNYTGGVSSSSSSSAWRQPSHTTSTYPQSYAHPYPHYPPPTSSSSSTAVDAVTALGMMQHTPTATNIPTTHHPVGNFYYNPLTNQYEEIRELPQGRFSAQNPYMASILLQNLQHSMLHLLPNNHSNSNNNSSGYHTGIEHNSHSNHDNTNSNNTNNKKQPTMVAMGASTILPGSGGVFIPNIPPPSHTTTTITGTTIVPSSSSSSSSVGGPLGKCKVDECFALVESNTVLYCIAHRGTRRCQKDGCNKCAQGATKYCIAHGGGRRCTYPGCFKGARDKFFCAAHGGGKRCTFQGCSKSAVGGSNLCTAHGGGKRCQYSGCSKSSQSSTNYCVRHGGGRSCSAPGCTKVARGKTEFCAAHGGGVRCKTKGCNRLAVGMLQLCRLHNGGAPGGGDGGEDDEYDDGDGDYSMDDQQSGGTETPSMKRQKIE